MEAMFGRRWNSNTVAATTSRAGTGSLPAIDSARTDGAQTLTRTFVRLFGKLGRQDARNDVSLTVSFANNSLNGNALQEQRMLAKDYSSVYTKPDNTHNRSWFFNLEGRRIINEPIARLRRNIYYRDIRTKTLNADINEDSLDQSVYQP